MMKYFILDLRTYETWAHRLAGEEMDIVPVVDFALARAHLDGFLLVRTGSKMVDGAMSRQTLTCSCAGIKSGATSRASSKCGCTFKITLQQEDSSVIIDEDDISHNHGPFASRIINDLLELDAPQRLLNKDEQDEIGKKLAEGASVEEASNLMATQIKNRYFSVLQTFEDDDGMELLEVSNSSFIR
jgi:hypothetical protein